MLLQKIFYHFHPIVSDLFGQSNQGETVGLFLMFMNNMPVNLKGIFLSKITLAPSILNSYYFVCKKILPEYSETVQCNGIDSINGPSLKLYNIRCISYMAFRFLDTTTYFSIHIGHSISQLQVDCNYRFGLTSLSKKHIPKQFHF